MKIPSSQSVFEWPEYKAFANRLGITKKATTKITITLEMDELVKVAEEYLATDEKLKELDKIG